MRLTVEATDTQYGALEAHAAKHSQIRMRGSRATSIRCQPTPSKRRPDYSIRTHTRVSTARERATEPDEAHRPHPKKPESHLTPIMKNTNQRKYSGAGLF